MPLLRFRPRPAARPAAPRQARVPAGQRLYVVGDIHGRVDLAAQMLDSIRADAAMAPPGLHHTLVFLGDYVDRGPDSRGVLDLLAGHPPPGFGAIFLKGNHEEAMLAFLADPAVGNDWLRFGGQTTLASYEVYRHPSLSHDEWLEVARDALAAQLPPLHLAFLRALRGRLKVGDYVFAHAGIRPGVPLDRQEEQDLLWIREPFLSSTADHGAVVVHGHTITEAPDIRHNRIGIDTGAYATGRLTCLVLEGAERRFLCTGDAPAKAQT